jgi:formylmethanofuran dehydrogenase subunit C
MPQENLNKIWNAGKYFEPKAEQPTKEPTPDETKPSNVKRKISVAKAFMPTQEDPFRKKVEAVLKGIEPAPALAVASKEEKPIPAGAEEIVGKGQYDIGKNLVAGKHIHVSGNAGNWTGESMSGGEIHVEGNAGEFVGVRMSGGEIHVEGNAGNLIGKSMLGGTLRIDGDVVCFGYNTFIPENKGTIIWKGQTIWKDGQQIEPGWTKLNVKEKIAEQFL